jgi:hypothetical protein
LQWRDHCLVALKRSGKVIDKTPAIEPIAFEIGFVRIGPDDVDHKIGMRRAKFWNDRGSQKLDGVAVWRIVAISEEYGVLVGGNLRRFALGHARPVGNNDEVPSTQPLQSPPVAFRTDNGCLKPAQPQGFAQNKTHQAWQRLELGQPTGLQLHLPQQAHVLEIIEIDNRPVIEPGRERGEMAALDKAKGIIVEP